VEAQQQSVQKFLLPFKNSAALYAKILAEFESLTAMSAKIITVIQNFNSTV
jgi:hypothetical protein